MYPWTNVNGRFFYQKRPKLSDRTEKYKIGVSSIAKIQK